MEKISKLFLAGLVLCSVSGVSCLELVANPKYFQGEPGSDFFVSCKSKSAEPIAGCQFRVWYDGKKEGGQVLNITESKDPIKIPNPYTQEQSYFTAERHSTDFKHGGCGVKLAGLAGGQLFIGCKLTTTAGETAVSAIPLYFPGGEAEILKLKHNSQVKNVKVGDDLSFQLQTKTLLTKCSMRVEGRYVDVVRGNVTDTKQWDVGQRYQGWLEWDKCGFTIKNFTESDSRTVFVLAASGARFIGAKVYTLILQQDTEMFLAPAADVYNVGDRVTATCNSRAVLHSDLFWSWTLGSASQGQDKDNKIIPRQDWAWPWETTLTSDTRSFVLTKDDNNKDISCSLQSEHDGGVMLEATKKIKVKQPTTTPTKGASPSTSTPTTRKSSTAEGNQDIASGANPSATDVGPGTEETTTKQDALQTWKLSISPADFVTISRNKMETVVCKANLGTKLSECGFQLDLEGQQHYWNASLGSLGEREVEFGPFTVNYHGLGLDQGECGIQLKAPGKYKEDNFILGCRARTENSGWKYNYINIVPTDWLPERTTLQTVPKWPFVLPGSSLTVRCDYYVSDKIEKCSFTLPGLEELDINENYKPQPPNFYSYVGEGLDKGHCGIFIPNVSKLDLSKGNTITCETMLDRRTYPTREISFVVSAPPTEGPSLTIVPPGFMQGPNVSFQCESPSNRPPATLAWYLGEQPLSADSITENPVSAWRWWRDQETVTQLATLHLTEQDQGKKLTCVMSHMALTGTRNSSVTLAFRKGKTLATILSPDRGLYTSIVFAVVVTILLAVSVVAEFYS